MIQPRILAQALLPALALVAACASAPTTGKPGLPFAPVTDWAGLRAVYDSGFARIVYAVPSPRGSDATPLRQLRDLIDFRWQQVAWATIRGDAYAAAEQGRRTGGWLAIVPPGHRLLRTYPDFIGIDQGSVHALVIRPAAVTHVWAGLLLVHFLSHLQDEMRATGGAPHSHTQALQAEIRIYWRMLAAADLLAQGRFRPALDSIIDRWHDSTPQDLAEHADTLELADVNRLNGTLPTDEPIPDAEMIDRASFYGPALLVRYAETHQVPLPDLLTALDHLWLASGGTGRP